tara:strand:- start:2060 stop:3031 length:972 start_codon:yes stop_codon:yes gene_type:complete
MHRYFLIPVISFFLIVLGFVLYLQFINENWKYLSPKIDLPSACNDKNEVKLVTHEADYVQGRSFIDSNDVIQGNQIHAIYLLPCERDDRKFDVNLNIQFSLLAINKWFSEKSANQMLLFDINNHNKIDVTFLRVNKTMNWFDDKSSNKNNNKIDISDKIKKIIFSNKDYFQNFDNKKFIVFFEGWERRKYINFDICGKADFEGKISIYYTFSRFKKYIGNDVILKNNKRLFTCTKNDHLNEVYDLKFGDAEATILHEILHTLGAPSKCGKNLDNQKSHVSDSNKDIMHKESGNNFLDYNNDDYYNHNIKECYDLKNSNFLKTN